MRDIRGSQDVIIMQEKGTADVHLIVNDESYLR